MYTIFKTNDMNFIYHKNMSLEDAAKFLMTYKGYDYKIVHEKLGCYRLYLSDGSSLQERGNKSFYLAWTIGMPKSLDEVYLKVVKDWDWHGVTAMTDEEYEFEMAYNNRNMR